MNIVLVCILGFIIMAHDVPEQKEGALLEILRGLKTERLDFEDLYKSFEENVPHKNEIDRQENAWLFELEKKDSNQFEKAFYLKPMCKVFSNQDIDVIAFTDLYDYKQAIHLFSFGKPEYEPLSSFVLYSLGGDAEDFWHTEATQIDSLKFQLTYLDGYYNDIETMDTIFYNSRKVELISINPENGFLNRELIKNEKNVYELMEE